MARFTQRFPAQNPAAARETRSPPAAEQGQHLPADSSAKRQCTPRHMLGVTMLTGCSYVKAHSAAPCARRAPACPATAPAPTDGLDAAMTLCLQGVQADHRCWVLQSRGRAELRGGVDCDVDTAAGTPPCGTHCMSCIQSALIMAPIMAPGFACEVCDAQAMLISAAGVSAARRCQP